MLIILGAGLTGLSCAFKLNKKKKYIIIEKENIAGGLCRSLKKDGFIFDYSGHLLHLRWQDTERFIKEILGNNIHKIKRNAKIFFNGKFIDYPFQINLYGLDPKIVSSCVRDFIQARVKNEKTDPTNFKKWSYQIFGKSISKYFMIPYNEKLYSHSSDNMTALWIDRFVPIPTVAEVIKGAYIKKVENTGYNHHFYYPKYGGIQTLVDKIYEKINHNVMLNAEVKWIDFNNKKIYLKEGRVLKYSRLISTIPLKKLILNSNAPSSIKKSALSLIHNTVYILNLGIKSKASDIHWIYFPQKNIPFYRAGIYTNFSKNLAPLGYSSLYIEFSFKPEIIPDIKKLEEITIKHLKKLSFISTKDEIITKMWTKIDCAYVIYNKEREKSLKKIFDFLKTKNVISTGRYGEWKYSFMEENIKDGFKVADKIIKEEL